MLEWTAAVLAVQMAAEQEEKTDNEPVELKALAFLFVPGCICPSLISKNNSRFFRSNIPILYLYHFQQKRKYRL